MANNNEVLRIFSGIMKDVSAFKQATNKADAEYAKAVEIAKEKAREYKDERGELQKRKDKARTAHNTDIFSADTSLAMNMRECHIPLMRDYLRKYLCSAPDASFMATLSYYRQFGLEMSRTELNNLLNMAGGNYIALKSLAAVAKDSGWVVSTPDAAEFEKDIALLEGRMTQRPILWHDTEHHKAACETRDTSSATSRAEAIRALKAYGIENGEDTVEWKATSLELLGAKASFDTVVGKIEEMMQRWNTGFVPSVVSYANELKKAGIDGAAAEQIGEVMRQVDVAAAADSAKVKDTTAEQVARKIGERRGKANAEAAKIREAYTAR